jgi:hypothetical protein
MGFGQRWPWTCLGYFGPRAARARLQRLRWAVLVDLRRRCFVPMRNRSVRPADVRYFARLIEGPRPRECRTPSLSRTPTGGFGCMSSRFHRHAASRRRIRPPAPCSAVRFGGSLVATRTSRGSWSPMCPTPAGRSRGRSPRRPRISCGSRTSPTAAVQRHERRAQHDPTRRVCCQVLAGHPSGLRETRAAVCQGS